MTILPPAAPEGVKVINDKLYFSAPVESCGSRIQGYEVSNFELFVTG